MAVGDVQLRTMVPQDVPGAFALADALLFGGSTADERAPVAERFAARSEHLMQTDPGGGWVAEQGGELVGVATSLVRERLWGLSLFAVAQDLQGNGVGRQLLDATRSYGTTKGAERWLIMSSSHPGALRSYATSGFDLHPAVGAAGIPDLRRAPDGVDSVIEVGSGGIAAADPLWREARGAGIGVDLPTLLAGGSRLLLLEDRAAVVVRGADLMTLAARDEQAAILALWAAFRAAPPGATANVGCITATQQWAIRTCLDAKLALTPDGALMTRGAFPPPRPWLPSGAFL